MFAQGTAAKVIFMKLGAGATSRKFDYHTATMQYGVYLYFSLEGGLIERYYDQPG